MRELTEEELIDFIRQNSGYLTMADMVAETGAPFSRIKKMADQIGVKAIGPKEQTIKFILENKDCMTVGKIIKALEMSDAYFTSVLKEIGMTKADFRQPEEGDSKKKRKWVHPREVFADFQISPHHYNHLADQPSRFDAWLAEIRAQRSQNKEKTESDE